MPLLGTLLVSLFGSLSSFLALFFAKQVAITLAGVAAVVALMVTLATAITGGLAAVGASLPGDSMVSTGLYFAVPANGPAVVAFVLSVDAAIAVYRVATDQVRMLAR